MKDEREDPRTKRSPDSRVEYGEVRREEDPAPYDVAPPGTPDDQIIRKGERERPGPTADELGDDPAQDDEVLQTNEFDREGGATLRRGKSGDLGGHERQRKNNEQAADKESEGVD